MIPPTKNGLNAMTCVSALQKCIRRGLEREAMEFAVELMHTNKSFFSLVCNRLEIISHEDIDTQLAPHVVVFVATAVEQAKRHYDPAKIGRARMFIGNAIRLMCRAAKSREGDHFAIAVGLASEVEGFVPTVPDWALDGHTVAGKRMDRGLAFFREHSAQLVPPPTAPDQYEAEAYRLLELRQKLKQKQKPDDLFDDE
jgi:replication-associated recombination protein RarA